MSNLKYNPIGDNFTVFKDVLNTKKWDWKSKLPLLDEIPVDWEESEYGTPIVTKIPEEEKTPKLIRSLLTDIYQPLPEEASLKYEQLKLSGNKKIAMEFFENKGLQRHLAAGLVGNLIRESLLNPNTINSKSGAYGIAQWLGSRKTKLFSKYGKTPSFELLLEFIWDELNSTHKTGLQKLLGSLTVKEAAANAFGWYEFLVGPTKAIQEMKKYGQDGVKSYNLGIKYAENLLA